MVGQPTHRTKLQAVIGETYRNLGLSHKAIPLEEQVWVYHRTHAGPDHSRTLSAMHSLALSYSMAGRSNEALELQEEVLRGRRKTLGLEHNVTLDAMNNLANSYSTAGRNEEALAMREDVLKLRHKVDGSEHPDTLLAINNLAASYHKAGRKDDALVMREQVLELSRKVLGPDHPDTLLALNNLAHSYHSTQRKKEALMMNEEVLNLKRKVLGPEHPETLNSMTDLALFYGRAGRNSEALVLEKEALHLKRKVLGLEHHATLTVMHNLSSSLSRAGRNKEAITMAEEVLDRRREVLGPEHPNTLTSMYNLALYYDDAGRSEEALVMGKQAFELRRKIFGPEHGATVSAMHNLALYYQGVGRHEEGLPMCQEVLKFRLKIHGPKHVNTIRTLNLFATFCASCKDPALRIEGYRAILRVDPSRIKFQYSMGESLVDAKQYSEALDPLQIALDHYSSVERSLDIRVLLTRSLEALERNAEANRIKAELAQNAHVDLCGAQPLPVKRVLIPPDSIWRWFHPTDGTDPSELDPDFHQTFFSPDYDDSHWAQGRDQPGPKGGFGYGDVWFNGVDIGSPKDRGLSKSAYFRARFTTTERHTHLELHCQRDDGVIVYLDGKEVGRDNMMPGEESYQLPAADGHMGEQTTFHIPLTGTLVEGEHVLAISLHNPKHASSDLRIGGISLVALEVDELSVDQVWKRAEQLYEIRRLRELGSAAAQRFDFEYALTRFRQLKRDAGDYLEAADILRLGAVLAYLGEQEDYRALTSEVMTAHLNVEAWGDLAVKMSVALRQSSNISNDEIQPWRTQAREIAMQLTAKGTEYNDYYTYALARGLAEYRLGEFNASEHWLTQAAKVRANEPGQYFFALLHAYRAMTFFQLNRKEAAQTALKTGLQRLPEIETYTAWHETVFAYLALREAWEMIEGKDKESDVLENWAK